MSKFFSTKSNAARAAKAVGLGRDNCYQTEAGTWGFRALAVDLGAPYDAQCVSYGDYLHSQPAKPTAPVSAPKAAASVAVPPAKSFEVYGRSSLLSPVAVVHGYLDKLVAAGVEPVRREALFALSQMGVNRFTARTQYQRWCAKRAGK